MTGEYFPATLVATNGSLSDSKSACSCSFCILSCNLSFFVLEHQCTLADS